MNYIDILLAIVILLSVSTAVARGGIIASLEVIAWAGSLITGFLCYEAISRFIEEYIGSLGIWTMPAAFLITVILSHIILSSIIYRIYRVVPATVHRHTLNKVMGIIPGLFNGLVWAAIIATILLLLPLSGRLPEDTRKSKIAGQLTRQVEWLDEQLSPVFDSAVNRSVHKMTVDTGSLRSVKLPYTVTDPKVRYDLEAEMLVMVNNERRKEGLPPLKPDAELAVVARQHSADMFARGYFSHYSPEGHDAAYRIRKGGVRFLTAGENLALARTLSIAHTGLMNSPGHRANILNPRYGRAGIGILDGGIYGLMVTQNFRN